MGFHVINLRRLDSSASQSAPDQSSLRRPVGGRQAIAAPIVIDGAAPDHSVDLVAIRFCLSERLENNETRTLTPHIAVCARIEGTAAPIRRQSRHFGERDGASWREDHVHPSGQGKGRFTA